MKKGERHASPEQKGNSARPSPRSLDKGARDRGFRCGRGREKRMHAHAVHHVPRSGRARRFPRSTRPRRRTRLEKSCAPGDTRRPSRYAAASGGRLRGVRRARPTKLQSTHSAIRYPAAASRILGAATLGSHAEEVGRAPRRKRGHHEPTEFSHQRVDRPPVHLGRPALAGRAAGPARAAALSLVTAANDLSRTMAHAAYRTVVPIAQFPER